MNGLSSKEVLDSRKLHGSNKLPEPEMKKWYDFAKEICDLSGNVCDIQHCHSDELPSKAKRPHFSVLDKTMVKSTFGITVPKFTVWRGDREDG